MLWKKIEVKPTTATATPTPTKTATTNPTKEVGSLPQWFSFCSMFAQHSVSVGKDLKVSLVGFVDVL